MKQEEIEKTAAVCHRMSEMLQGLEDKIFPWADTEAGLYEDFYEELEEYSEILEDMTEELIIACSNQFTAGKIFTNPAILKKFLDDRRHLLNREEKQFIRNFLKNPWFYAVFSVAEEIGKNFLRIYDYTTKETTLLYSKGVRQQHRYGYRLYLCLLFDNGECLQTYGTINYFRGFSTGDIKSFARFTGHHFERSGNLSAAIYHNPLPFLLLFLFAEFSPIMFHGQVKEFCYHCEKVESFSPADLAGELNIDEKEGIIQLTRNGSLEPDFFQGIYYEKKNSMLHVHALGIKYYKSIVELLQKHCHFPGEPSWRVGAQMMLALNKILDVRLPVYEFEQLFTRKPDQETSAKIKKLDGFMQELTDCHNKGIDPSLEKLAEKHDLQLSEIPHLLEEIDRTHEQFHIDIEGGFKDFAPPPPELRMKLREPFPGNSLFEFNNSAKADSYLKKKLPELKEDLEVLGYDEKLPIAELPDFLEDLFFAYWEVEDSTILLYTLYLLSKKGKTFLPVRDYAVEVLRIWPLILPEKSQQEIEIFIKSYGTFVFNVLYSVGLVEVQIIVEKEFSGKTDFDIKAKPFFYEWIRFNRSQ